jgi:hypothetical protein
LQCKFGFGLEPIHHHLAGIREVNVGEQHEGRDFVVASVDRFGQ